MEQNNAKDEVFLIPSDGHLPYFSIEGNKNEDPYLNFGYYQQYEHIFIEKLYNVATAQNKKVLMLVHHLQNIRAHRNALTNLSFPGFQNITGTDFFYKSKTPNDERDEMRNEFKNSSLTLFFATPNMYNDNEIFRDFVRELLDEDKILLGMEMRKYPNDFSKEWNGKKGFGISRKSPNNPVLQLKMSFPLQKFYVFTDETPEVVMEHLNFKNPNIHDLTQG